MKKKIFGIFVIMLMISSAMTTILFSDNSKVEASGGQQQGGGVNLDYDWVWDRVKDFARVVRETNWSSENNIPKGRCWATAGENFTINKILKPNMQGANNPCGVSGYTKLPIGYIGGKYKDWNYSSKVVLTNFNFTIHNDTNHPYPFPKTVPITEIFAAPTAIEDWDTNKITLTYKFTNAIPKIDSLFNTYPFGGTYTNYYIDISCENENQGTMIIGNVSYLLDDDPIPSDQEGQVFLVNDTLDNQDRLDNITQAEGCILLKSGTASTQLNVTECCYPVVSMDKNSNESSEILDLLNQGERMIVDNATNPSILTFTYNLAYPINCPDDDYMIVYSVPTSNFLPQLYLRARIYKCFNWVTKYWNVPHCLGIIIYDQQDTDAHYMLPTTKDWNEQGAGWTDNPALPIFSVNNSVGNWLHDNYSTTTINANLSQVFKEQTPQGPGVISHNVVAYRNATNNPDKKIVILNNRMDAWWSEAPGDSGVGGAILLGIAKYFKDNNITPKYDIRFLFTTGEEYGCRGNYHYRHSLDDVTDNSVVAFFALDQIGLAQKATRLGISYNNNHLGKILEKIVSQSNYDARSKYAPTIFSHSKIYGSAGEDEVWKDNKNCDAFCFAQDACRIWKGYHRAGMNYSRGDTLSGTVPDEGINQTVVNISFELAWNVTKYFTVNPDCWFENITYQTWDSPTDNNTLIDSVNVTFSVNSCLPQDRIWVKATLISQDYPILCRYTEQRHYIITPSGIQDTISITLPLQAPKGNYTLQVFLYNSTGEIDRSLITLLDYRDFGQYANEIYQTDEFSLYLYPSNDQPETPHRPWGDTQVSQFKINIYKSHTTDPNDDHLWYQWQYEYHQLLGPSIETRYTNWTLGGPHDSGKNDTTYIIWLVPGTYNVRVRAKDNIRNPNMITDWSPPLQVTVSPFINGSIPWSSQFISEFSFTRVAENQQTECKGFAVGVLDGNEGSLNFTWDFGDNTGAYSENVNHDYSDEGNYTVNLTLKNSLNETYNFTTTISVVVIRAGFSTSGDEQPGKNIYFNDTSRGSSSLVNWSWEFGDGNRSYDQNTSHMYTETGEYNITLTVKDTLNNTDIYTKPVFIESLAPEFVSVVDSPDRVGFGSNVMISADFFDNQSGVESVMVNITYPDNTTGNFSMGQNVSSEHDFVYVFNDIWQNGVYNYSIWVVDHANNTNYTSGFNFTVSADATISICTVKNIFNKSEWINFTDPPAHPVNTLDAWQLINRGETWNQYYDQQEKTYRISCSDTPINYKDTGNNYQPINTTIQPLIKEINDTMYTRGVTRGIYSLYLKQTMNATDTTPMVIIEKDRYKMTQTPPDSLTVSYNQKQKLSTICTQNTSQMTQDGDTVLYEHAYQRYNTTDDYAQVSYQYYPTMMKSNLILTDQNAVQDRYTLLNRVLRTDNLWVQYQTQMTSIDTIGNISLGVTQNDVIYRLYGENITVDLWTADRIWFTDQNNTPVFAIPPLYAVDNVRNATLLMKHLHCEENTDMMTLTIYVSLPWLADDNRMYPVYIDPSVEINAGTGDGWAKQDDSANWNTVHDGSGNGYSSSNTYAYGIGADCGMTGKYSIHRSFFRFNTSSIPDNASFVNASVFLYGKFYNSQPQPVPTPQASGVVFQKWTGGGTISSGDYNDFSGGIYGSLSSWTTYIYNELAWENALSDIDVDGYTDICVREWAHDYNNSAPEEESSYSNYLAYADAPYNKPYINVTYELPPTSPEVTLIIPEDYEMNISLNPCVKVSVTQQEGKDVTVQWYQNATAGSWTLFATNVTDGNETVMQNCPWINENGKWYHLKIDAKVGSWPSVQEYYQFYPGVQSKIENTGDTDINGFLVVWLEEYNATSGNWSYLDELYRDATMRRVNSSCSFGIDTVCNGLMNGSMFAGETGGVFRVYAGFYSLHDEVLVCSDDTELVAWWEFEIE